LDWHTSASVRRAITPADVVWNRRPAPAFLPSLLNSPAPRSFSNEFAESRAGILTPAFSRRLHDPFDAAHINDHLDAGIVPSVV